MPYTAFRMRYTPSRTTTGGQCARRLVAILQRTTNLITNMKLHLPSGLLAALLAGFLGSASSAHALIVWDTVETDTFDTSADSTTGHLSYNASTGLIQEVDSNTSNIVTSNLAFTLNNSALRDNTSTSTPVIYVSNSSHNWGFNANGSSLVGRWDNNNWNAESLYVSQDTLSQYGEGDIQLDATIDRSGTTLAHHDTNLYNASGLKSSDYGVLNMTVNKDFISSVTVGYTVDNGGTNHVTVRNTNRSWSVTYDTVARVSNKNVSYDNGSVNATLATAERLDVTNTNIDAINANGGTIVAGGAGQLFLQTWGSGNLELNNDIILGSSSYTDMGNVQYGALRFGNDGGTVTLNGNITLVENAVISGTVRDAQDVNINGTISGNYGLTILQGVKLHFNENISVGSLTFTGQSETTINNGLTTTGGVTVTGAGDTTGSTVTIKGNTSIGGNLTGEKNSVINLSAGTHRITNLDASQSKSFAGSVNIGKDAAATVTGTIWLGSHAEITVAEGGNLTKGEISISGKGTTGATITNTDTADSHDSYDLSRTGYTISNAAVTVTSNNAITLSNRLTDVDLTHVGTGTLTVDNAANTLTAIATDSTLHILNATEAVIASVTLGDGATVGIYTGNAANGDSGTLSSTSLKAGSGASLAASLTLGGESALLDLGNALAIQGALALGSDITLQGDILNGGGEKITLFTGVESFTVNGENYTDIVAASEIFKGFQNTDTTHYSVSYEGDTVYFITRSVPEPTTATLGLLALAGLCARRRRR